MKPQPLSSRFPKCQALDIPVTIHKASRTSVVKEDDIRERLLSEHYSKWSKWIAGSTTVESREPLWYAADLERFLEGGRA